MKKVVICLVLFLFVFSFASAEEVSIEIETLANHDLVIGVLDAGKGYSLLDSTKVKSDSDGKVKVAFSVNRNLVDVGVTLNKDGSKILYKRFEDYSSSETISLKIIPGGYIGDAADDPDAVVEEVNETIVNETVEEVNETIGDTSAEITSEETDLEDSAITGNVASNVSSSIVQNWYYLVGVAFLLVAIFLVVFGKRLLSHPATSKVINSVTPSGGPYSSNKSYQSSQKNSSIDPRVAEAERKILEAQNEIKKIKSESRIAEAERKIKEDQERLERLRRGEE